MVCQCAASFHEREIISIVKTRIPAPFVARTLCGMKSSRLQYLDVLPTTSSLLMIYEQE